MGEVVLLTGFIISLVFTFVLGWSAQSVKVRRANEKEKVKLVAREKEIESEVKEETADIVAKHRAALIAPIPSLERIEENLRESKAILARSERKPGTGVLVACLLTAIVGASRPVHGQSVNPVTQRVIDKTQECTCTAQKCRTLWELALTNKAIYERERVEHEACAKKLAARAAMRCVPSVPLGLPFTEPSKPAFVSWVTHTAVAVVGIGLGLYVGRLLVRPN